MGCYPPTPTILHLPKHAHMNTVSIVKQKRRVGEGGRDGKPRERENGVERKERQRSYSFKLFFVSAGVRGIKYGGFLSTAGQRRGHETKTNQNEGVLSQRRQRERDTFSETSLKKVKSVNTVMSVCNATS